MKMGQTFLEYLYHGTPTMQKALLNAYKLLQMRKYKFVYIQYTDARGYYASVTERFGICIIVERVEDHDGAVVNVI